VAHDAVSTSKAGPLGIPLPSKITIVVADQLYIDRTDCRRDDGAAYTLGGFQNPSSIVRNPCGSDLWQPRIIFAPNSIRVMWIATRCLDEAVDLIRGEGAELSWTIKERSATRFRAGPVPGSAAQPAGQGIRRLGAA